MQLSWSQHLETARLIENCSTEDRGTALALMGMALLVLSEDLARAREQQQPVALR